jgi:hypothetical protein
MNNVNIYVAENQLNTNTLLIEGDCLDLFEIESIPFTLKQTDLADLGANYTNFTKDFVIPASPKNNRILRYWLDIKNDNQFQTNIPIPARIDISGIYFSIGVIKIMSFITNDNGDPKSYTITFTGSLVALKTLFGDGLISGLPFDSPSIFGSDEFDFTDYGVVSSITSPTTYKNLEIPMISTNRIITNYSTIAYVGGANNATGIKRSELRPALKFRTIIDCIKLKYGVDFIGDFIDGEMLDKLYLWLNKNESLYNSGGTVIRMGGTLYTNQYVEYHPNTTTDMMDKGYVTLIKKPDIEYYTLTFRTFTLQNDTPYRVKIQEVILNSNGTINETLTAEQPNFGILSTGEYMSGGNKYVVLYTIDYRGKIVPNGEKRHFRFSGETENEKQVALINYNFRVMRNNNIFNQQEITVPSSTLLKNITKISTNLPEMKIQEFLTSLIKMFNLVIVPKLNNTYVLDFYNNYYAGGGVIDITKYCSPLKKMNRVKTYKEISFKPDESEYAGNKQYKAKQPTIREYGEQVYKFKDGDIESFKVEYKFGLIQFRELNGVDFVSDHTLNNTWIIGDGTGPDNGIITNKPTIFFNNGKSSISENKYVTYIKDDNTTEPLTSYSQFSNLDNLTNYTTTLCFSVENMFGAFRPNNLYKSGYEKLMKSLVSPYSREYEIDAVLPKHIFTTLSLNNRLVIGNESFSISEITVDLLTGKSKLKLNNIIH